MPALSTARPVGFTSHLPECCWHPLPTQVWVPTLSSSHREGCLGLGQDTHHPMALHFVGQHVGGRVLPRQRAFWYLASPAMAETPLCIWQTADVCPQGWPQDLGKMLQARCSSCIMDAPAPG